jgi:hypothetical protein
VKMCLDLIRTEMRHTGTTSWHDFVARFPTGDIECVPIDGGMYAMPLCIYIYVVICTYICMNVNNFVEISHRVPDSSNFESFGGLMCKEHHYSQYVIFFSAD